LTDPNVIATTVSAIGILVGVYSIVNRSEDRINRRMDQRFESIEQRFSDRFNDVERRFTGMEKLFTEKLLRVEQVMDARIKHLEEKP
jgi:hypothetical protein